MKKNETCQHTEGPGHDCEYVDARNRLIPEAAEYARTMARKLYPNDLVKRETAFNRLFHQRMKELAKEGGLTT